MGFRSRSTRCTIDNLGDDGYATLIENDNYTQGNSFEATGWDQVSAGETVTGSSSYGESTTVNGSATMNGSGASYSEAYEGSLNSSLTESGGTSYAAGVETFWLTHAETSSDVQTDGGWIVSDGEDVSWDDGDTLLIGYDYHATGPPATTVTDFDETVSTSYGGEWGGFYEGGEENTPSEVESRVLYCCNGYRGDGSNVLTDVAVGAVHEGTDQGPVSSTAGLLGEAGSQVMHAMLIGPQLGVAVSGGSTGSETIMDGDSTWQDSPPEDAMGYTRPDSGSPTPVYGTTLTPSSGQAIPVGSPDEVATQLGAGFPGTPEEPGVLISAPPSRAAQGMTPPQQPTSSGGGGSGGGSSGGGGSGGGWIGPIQVQMPIPPGYNPTKNGGGHPTPGAATGNNQAISGGAGGGGGSGSVPQAMDLPGGGDGAPQVKTGDAYQDFNVGQLIAVAVHDSATALG